MAESSGAEDGAAENFEVDEEGLTPYERQRLSL